MSLLICSCSTEQHTNGEFDLQKETDHFLIYCLEQDMQDIDQISNALETYYTKINRNFNVKPSKKIPLTVYPNLQQFHNAISMLDSLDWLVVSSENGELKMVSPSGYIGQTHTKENIIISAEIELIKLLTLEINDKTPMYLSTGIALYETNENIAGNIVVPAINNSSFATIKQLAAMKEEDSEKIYAYSYVLVDYIVDQYGYAKLTEFIKKPKIKAVFGISEKEFEADWVDYVKNIYDTQFDLKKETEHFTFYYMIQDASVTEEIAKGLEENYKRITDDLQTEPISKVTVMIYPDTKLFEKVKISDSVLGVGVGGYMYDMVKIKMISPNAKDFTNSYGDMIAMAVHEFTHTVVAAINRDTPDYLNEGIASYEANYEDSVVITVTPLLRQAKFPTIEEISKRTVLDNRVYQFGYVFVEYVVEKYGYDKLIELIKTPDISTIFGVSENEFEKAWITYLNNQYVH